MQEVPPIPQDPHVTPESNAKPGCTGNGCVLWGCLTLAILGLVAAVLVGLGVYTTYQKVLGFLDDKPRKIEVYVPSAEEKAAAQVKFKKLKELTEQGLAGDVSLTESDMNTLLTTPGIQELLKQSKGQMRFKIDNGKLKAEVSLCMDQFHLKGKYLNGMVRLRFGGKPGMPQLFMDDVEVNGGHLDAPAMKIIRQKNLLENVSNDPNNPKAREFIERIKRLEIKDNQLQIELAAKPGGGSSQSTPAAPVADPSSH